MTIVQRVVSEPWPEKHRLCMVEGCGIDAVRESKYCYIHRPSKGSQGGTNAVSSNCEYIYFIMAPDVGVVKIGRTKSLKQRMKALAAMSPARLVPVAYIYDKRELEGWLHKALKDHRHHGEWFKLEDVVISIVEWARDRKFKRIYDFLRAREVI